MVRVHHQPLHAQQSQRWPSLSVGTRRLLNRSPKLGLAFKPSPLRAVASPALTTRLNPRVPVATNYDRARAPALAKSHLPVINEHLSASPARVSRPRFADEDLTFQEEDSDDDNGELFPWEEEETLVHAMLSDGPCHEADRDKMVALAESLQAPFDNHAHILKQDIAKTLVPTVKRVKQAHRTVAEKIDQEFGQGLVLFDDACQKMEAMTMREEDELKTIYLSCRTKLQELFDELGDAYERRSQLWVELDKSINDTVDPIVEDLENLPSRIERSIASLDKQSRDIHKDNGKSKKDDADYFKKMFKLN
ncbi:hypothetical protein HGRIS_012940 [Hohenbuehelia grisea]|uniref:Uncharacterized protein n=1 Tax=Hohenbuehelia grisea TaxID=104357 RepID=A0ABR3ITW4_9AGAR